MTATMNGAGLTTGRTVVIVATTGWRARIGRSAVIVPNVANEPNDPRAQIVRRAAEDE